MNPTNRIQALADSGFVYAVLDGDDDDHTACLGVLKQAQQIVYLPTITLPEIAFLVQRNVGHMAIPRFMRALQASPMIWIDPVRVDYERAIEIMEQYADAKLDLVDCVIAGMVERLNITRILSLDVRDFSLIRPRHAPSFERLP